MPSDHPPATSSDTPPGAEQGRPVLVVKTGAGLDDAERCAQAVTVAATAVAAGAEVSLWLMGDAVRLAVPGAAEGFTLEGSPPLAGLRDAVLHGGVVTVCTQCAARRGLSDADLLPGVRIAGAASYVEEILRPGVQALVY
jgi:predicted peroxiredoxin